MSKFLITGLGNIGAEYDHTRHNIGFAVVDALAAEHNAIWKADRFGMTTEFRVKNKILLLLKPDTYMNLSGKAIKFWLQKENIPVEQSLTILDDLNIPFGKIRIKGKGSDGGHNGLKSIQDSLQSVEYPRLRFGVGSEFSKGAQVNYVLGKWSASETEALPELLKKCGDACKAFALSGLNNAMNQFNG